MSKTFRSFLFVFAAVIQILHLLNNSNAQDTRAFIKIDSQSPTKVAIHGKFLTPKRNLSFLASYGDTTGLADRVSNVVVFDANDERINIRRMMSGEYLADKPFTKWSYERDLAVANSPFKQAHVSWLDNGGVLMLDDLLPQQGRNTPASIAFDIPRNWALDTNEKPGSPDTLLVKNVEKSVIFIATDSEQFRFIHTGTSVEINISGDWLFADSEAKDLVVSTLDAYKRNFGSVPLGDILVALRKFPMPVAGDQWEADTRGHTVTIFSSDTPFKSQSLQRLHEQLRHEMFHLWFPNGVNLSGHYDWFYEGFALYQSLKTGVALNRIRFDDYLDTLSRAYEIDKGRSQKISLIDASKNRWVNDNNTYIYARGMLVAFMCDVALLEKSKGKRSITDILRKLYESHRPPNPETDGNTAVLALLRSYAELTPITDRNITGAESIDWSVLIKAAGLEADPTAATTNLKVTAKPSGRQKDLLDKLGYNNWRKLASK